MLTTDTQSPEVSKTAMGPDLLQPLEVLTDLAVEGVGHDLRELAILDVLLPVEEPVGNLVLARVVHDRNQLLNLLIGELSSALCYIHVSLLADNVSITTTNTLNGCKCKRNFALSFNVRVHNTKNVLKLLWQYKCSLLPSPKKYRMLHANLQPKINAFIHAVTPPQISDLTSFSTADSAAVSAYFSTIASSPVRG